MDPLIDQLVTPAAVRFTVTVYVTAPCDDTGYPSYGTNGELERAIIHHLRKLDGDVDCEVMTRELLNADGGVL